MSEQYQHTEYELRNDIDNISCIPYTFERYVEEVNSFIDRIIKSDIKQLHDKDKEIERLNNIIKRLEEDLREMYLTFGEFSEEYTENRIRELKGSDKE